MSRVARVSRASAEGVEASRQAAARAVAAVADDPERDDGGTFQHLRSSAATAGVHKPAGAAASVFDLARQASKQNKPPRVLEGLPDPDKLVFETGVPIPGQAQRKATIVYSQILDRMVPGTRDAPGTSIVLTIWQARCLGIAAKKRAILTTKRNISATHARVWRLIGDAESDGRRGCRSNAHEGDGQ